MSAPREGHPISVEVIPYDEVFAPPLRPCGDHLSEGSYIERIYGQRLSCLIVRGAFSPESCEEASAKLSEPSRHWSEPNRGMKGGEIKTIGAAATPTFSSFTGPEEGAYLQSARELESLKRELFTELDPLSHLQELLSELAGGARARPPRYIKAGEELGAWVPFNYRALEPGEQIYSHHDAHYKLPIYEGFPAELDQHSAVSWFVTLQAPEAGGELTLYGLWGTDPNPPMLPTRFIDTEALESSYLKERIKLETGDLVLFDSGRFVHRVTPVEGSVERITMGGFLTLSHDRSQLAFWS